MTDKEKIRAEVERLLEEWNWNCKLCSSAEAKYRCEVYKEILEFIDSISEESVSEDLIRASVTYNEVNGKLKVIGGDNILSEEEYLAFNKNPDFIAGANWQKQQMMKDAIEGVYDCDDDNSWIKFKGWEESTSKVGNKVKLIIVKED